MTFTDLAIIALVGALLFLIDFIVSKADQAIEETHEERMTRLVAGMRARSQARSRVLATHPARRQGE